MRRGADASGLRGGELPVRRAPRKIGMHIALGYAEETRGLRVRDGRLGMTVTALLVVLLVLLLIGALPVYPYSRNWGYYPSGMLAVVVALVALMLLL